MEEHVFKTTIRR